MAGGYARKMLPGEKARDFKGTVIRLFKYLKPFTVMIIVAFAMVIVSTVFGVLSPSILGNATDVVVAGVREGSFNYDKLLRIILILLILYLCSWFFETAQGWITATVSQKVIYRLRKEISEKLDRLPASYPDLVGHGEIQSRMVNDIETINQTLNGSISHMITATVTLVGVLIMMIRIDLLMTVIAILVVPASMLLMRFVVRKSQGYFRKQQECMGKVNNHVEEMISGHTEVQLCNRQKSTIKKFEEHNSEFCQASRRAQIISGLVTPVTKLIGNFGYVIACFMGGWLALNGKISIGQVQAFIQYVGSLNMPVQQVANIANQLQMAAAAAERIFLLIDEEEEENPWNETESSIDFASDTVGHVAFENVEFGYNPDQSVIRNFSLDVEPGKRIAIVGPTGAGKTTIMKLLMRYHEISSGVILVDGVDIRAMSRHDLRKKFGLILQDTWLKGDTIRENIRFGRSDATDDEVERAAEEAQIDKLIRSMSGGYDMIVNEDATNISAGQKQLITIARAILADAPIMILDEATSSVDTRTERHVQRAMEKLMRGRTSFIIAHRLSTIEDADCIIVMSDGAIVEKGTHEELMQSKGLYADLYESQFERETEN